MVEGVRAFLAIELPETTRDELADWKRRLAPGLSGFRWGRIETLHLTLRFLGNLSPERFEEVGALLSRGLPAGGPLELFPSGLGVFPDARRPRVLWAGLGGDTARLARLALLLEASLEGLGFAREGKAFRPHLTLARAAGPVRPGPLAKALEGFSGVSGAPFTAAEVLLFQSILEPGGARHIPRRRGLLL